jgi:hypothetical protein
MVCNKEKLLLYKIESLMSRIKKTDKKKRIKFSVWNKEILLGQKIKKIIKNNW